MTRYELAQRVAALKAQREQYTQRVAALKAQREQYTQTANILTGQINILEAVLNGDLDLSLSDVAEHELGVAEHENTGQDEAD
jgi:uncharacterized coiled-coil DUF342 family protein